MKDQSIMKHHDVVEMEEKPNASIPEVPREPEETITQKQVHLGNNLVVLCKSTNKMKHIGTMHELYPILKSNGLSIQETISFMNELKDENYDSESIVQDLMNDDDRYNVYKQSNLFPKLNYNKSITNRVKKHFGQNHGLSETNTL